VLELTESGAGFELEHPVEAGRLIHLTFPMPKKLRAFDYNEDDYEIWGVLRYVRIVQPEVFDRVRISVGTAFIGKNPPNSFREDPTTRYDLRPAPTKEGLWKPRALPRHSGRFARPIEPRHNLTTRLLLETLNEFGQVTGLDEAETINVSESGAAVATKLATEEGRFVRLTVRQSGRTLLAVVRGSREDTSGARLLHLEFVSGKWQF
jgi:hypothetical protein